ncbi:MAG: T9SS type A sorting domain-containing protein [Saprospiraceae bacterium]|nr:T9SS type A sorting domain-containing protein [Saprospiraceae bacterium]
MNIKVANRKWYYPGFLGLAVAVYLAYQFISLLPLHREASLAKGTFQSPPPAMFDRTFIGEREAGGKSIPEAWLKKIHKAAPGDDWRAIESNSIRQLIMAKQSWNPGILAGSWVERGPSNIPGRIVDMEIDYSSDRIYAISDHGIVFRSVDLEGNNWTALNDQFPLGLGVASQLKVFSDGNIVASGWIKVDNYWGTYHSGDNGQSWQPSTGFSGRPITGIKRMAKQADSIYLFMQEYDPVNVSDYYMIYKSVDKGNSFTTFYQSSIPVGDGGRHTKSDLWVSNDAQDPNLYLMLEDSLFLVDKASGSRTFNGLVSNLPLEQGLLTGLTKNGHTELTAYIAVGGVGKFFSWNSTDQIWAYQGEMTDWWLALPFGPNSFTCSGASADTLYFGGLLTSKSSDRGATWTTMDLDPTGSYALYHGDVPKTYSAINPHTNKEEMYLGTDGGIYKLGENEHFNSMSIPGLNCTQIYKMVSRQSNPGAMFIGTQDNGYSHTSLGIDQPGVVDFTFQWGGDVSNAASGDGGNTFWLWWLGDGCNYMSGPDAVVSTWSPYDFNGGIPYWEAPIWVPAQYPDRCYTAGFLNNNSGNYLIRLQANTGTAATATQFSYNFEAAVGGKISAIAISPLDFNYFYVTTENGYFCYSTDGGNTWQSTLLSPSMYPRTILPSKMKLGEVWVGGSGYSNSPVFHTTDNGQSFSNYDTGMPACMAEAFATNEDESILFAATSIGPFACETGGSVWSVIAGTDAPIVQYMDVEYMTATKTARFATFARGVWDFQLMTTPTSQVNKQQTPLKVSPNPAREFITIETGDALNQRPFVITNAEGKVMLNGKFDANKKRIDISTLPSGAYFVIPTGNKYKPVKFVKK